MVNKQNEVRSDETDWSFSSLFVVRSCITTLTKKKQNSQVFLGEGYTMNLSECQYAGSSTTIVYRYVMRPSLSFR